MPAYLIVDVDDLLEYLQAQPTSPNISDVAATLRNTAALAAGLTNSTQLVAIAVADWNRHPRAAKEAVNVQQIFVSSGYDLFNISERKFIVDALLTHFFPLDTEDSIDELILATSQSDLTGLINRVSLDPHVRVRVWADVAPSAENVVFQPLESILGVQTKTIAMYIDFENITISLNEQGYIVDIDVLIQGLKMRSQHYGQLVHIAAYAPWGQRGSLPPMLDQHGREISDEIPSRLALESIDPVFSLPGKNSADLRIAKDVLAESSGPGSADVVIISSGDRDFNDIYNTLRARGKTVIVWGVRGSTSRVLENNTLITLEYVDDFVLFRRHKDLATIFPRDEEAEVLMEEEDSFRPSQWSSLILQFDRLAALYPNSAITRANLGEQLVDLHVATNKDRASDLIDQAAKIGILTTENGGTDALQAQPSHPVVMQTRLIRDHVVQRVTNTLTVRQWDYVNYGFLLKGIAMDSELNLPGMNTDDNWRSEWIDFLVREGILIRDLIPHRHNPDDLVPVIHIPTEGGEGGFSHAQSADPQAIEAMMIRVLVSVEQFTSFRKFAWCPLGSLHKRLRAFDSGFAFQHSVEELRDQGAITIEEYTNPQSDFLTKGVAIRFESEKVQQILRTRDRFIEILLALYDRRESITFESLKEATGMADDELKLWMSLMELENVLNPVPGHPEIYSLFRTHHTVSLVAQDEKKEEEETSDEE